MHRPPTYNEIQHLEALRRNIGEIQAQIANMGKRRSVAVTVRANLTARVDQHKEALKFAQWQLAL